MIYLKEGHVCGMVLPLHPDIEARWRNGQLTRVQPDGSPWQDSDGDPFAVLPGAAPAGDGTHIAERSDNDDNQQQPDPAGSSQPPRPKGNAPRPEWAAYAVALGVTTAEQAAMMTRDELKTLVTPPEMEPKIPDDPAFVG